MDPAFHQFHLVGGSALSLQLGHRQSLDLDFFSSQNFGPQLITNLENYGKVRVISTLENTIEAEVNKTKVFLMYFGYPLYEELVVAEGIRMAGVIDIGLMKLICLHSRNTKKDIIDLFFIDREVLPLEKLLTIFEDHFPEESFNQYSSAKELLNPDRLEEQPLPKMVREVDWEEAYQLVSTKMATHLARSDLGLT